jgi:hypothetical protein
LRLEGLEDRRLLTFAPAVDYPVGDSPQAIVAADFNNDSILDLATANYWDHTVSVLLGNADGTFQQALTSATGAYPRSLTVGDLDSDGILDLAVAGGYGYDYGYGYFFGGEVSVLLGNDNGAGSGDGTFQAPAILQIGQTPTSVAVGDFNDDGLLDIGATAVQPYYYYGYFYGYLSDAKVLLGNGSGGFAGPNSTWIGWGYLTSATAEDLDGDGADELIAANAYGYGYYYGDVAVFAGNASGYLDFPEFFYSGADALSVAVEDVNADGAFDIVTANGGYNSVSVLLGDQLGGFGAAQTYLAGAYPNSVVLGDFNQDAALDIATANSSGSDVSVLYGDGAGAFAPPVNTSSNGAYVLAAGDFNGDTWIDLATVNPGGNKVSILINDQTWPAAPGSLSIDDVTVIEGNSGTVAAVFTVTRGGDLAGEVTVNYSTSNSGALAGSDYVADSGTLTFLDGVDTMMVTILVNGDLIDEYDQGFFVTLSAPSGAIIVDGSGFGQIVDDDDPPTISITSVSGKEGANRKMTSLVFVVTLSGPSEKDIWVNFTTADGTATVADGDYVADSGTLYFAPGTTSQTISILVQGDKKKESDETFSVLLSGATNATIAAGAGIGVIVNDDGPGGKGKP